MDFITYILFDKFLPFTLAGICIAVGAILSFTFIKSLRLWLRGKENLQSTISSNLRVALYFFLPLLLAIFIFPSFGYDNDDYSLLNKILYILLVISFTWVLLGFVDIVENIILTGNEEKVVDAFHKRQVMTQVKFLKKIVRIVIFIIAVSLILIHFEGASKLGAGILTAGGVFSIMLGFAAQKSISNVFAGFQIAFTQSLRLGDKVIVEGDFGTVEEITLTYVIIQTWDLRRLVVPITYFVENPFQNWSKSSTELIGVVFLFLDYSVPLDKIRNELDRILKEESQGLWNGRISFLQVTDATERNIQVRCLMTADDAAKAFDLRCIVREKLITYIQNNYPESLPVLRLKQSGDFELSSGQPDITPPLSPTPPRFG